MLCGPGFSGEIHLCEREGSRVRLERPIHRAVANATQPVLHGDLELGWPLGASSIEASISQWLVHGYELWLSIQSSPKDFYGPSKYKALCYALL